MGSEGGRVAPERPRAGRWVEGGRHAVGQAARGRSRGQRAALEGRAQTCWTWTWTWTWVGEFWWFEMRSAQSVVVRNAMPPLGDTDGAGGSDAAGEAPQSVAFLPMISEPVERDQLHSNLSTTLRPLVERERRERGDEDGAVGVAGDVTFALKDLLIEGGDGAEATSHMQINWNRVKRHYFEVYLFRSAKGCGCSRSRHGRVVHDESSEKGETSKRRDGDSRAEADVS